MKIIDIINKLNTQSKELFDKAFNIWCNFIYEKDAVYTEELVTLFIKDTSLDSCCTDIFIDEKKITVKNTKWFLIYLEGDKQSNCILTMYYAEMLNNFIKEYGANRIN